VKEDGTRRRELVDVEQLDQESREALEADDFVIYGRASVEMFDEDEPSQMLTMEALAKALPQLYEDGIISRRHKDIPVGEVTPEHELEEPTDVQVGENTLTFEAGDRLETQVVEEGEPRPGDGGGTASEDEFWIVARLKNASEIAKETRLRALAGDLDGFSVTIYAKEWEETEQGQVVTELDWHAVTIGEEHKIKNKESRFGVAEFKARFEDALTGVLPGSGDAGGSASSLAEQVHTKANTTMSDHFNGQLFTKAGSDLGFDESRLAAAADLMQKSEPSDDGFREKADEIAEQHEVDVDSLIATAKAMSGDESAKASDDLEAILSQVEEQINPEARAAIEMAMGGSAPSDDEGDAGADADEAKEGEMKGDGEGPPGEEEEEEEEEEKSGGDELPDGAVTKEELDQRLTELQEETVSKEDLESVKSDLEEASKSAISEALPGIVEDVGEKMATGETTSPAGGSTADSVDYSEDIAGAFSPGGGGD